ncbi:MAG TPA: Holliday junction resolvase RuvX [Bacteroidales bacterium]|nr:Holliday junction resolvase RuvX [Bacteroidales bacterium]HPS71576.1 Holliday junction resolvase RuvX [Bacteroidales bacterium]
MGRILAIDYGQKRVGFAATDELRICANGLDTVHVSKAFDFIVQYVSKEKVDIIVIGEPKTMKFEASDSSRFIEPFVNRLKKAFPDLKIDRYDERFTSKMAFQTMIEAGLSKKQRTNKELVDMISATIILQSYMQQIEIETERNNTLN